jgi:hypothetical protein
VCRDPTIVGIAACADGPSKGGAGALQVVQKRLVGGTDELLIGRQPAAASVGPCSPLSPRLGSQGGRVCHAVMTPGAFACRGSCGG